MLTSRNMERYTYRIFNEKRICKQYTWIRRLSTSESKKEYGLFLVYFKNNLETKEEEEDMDLRDRTSRVNTFSITSTKCV